MAYLSDIEIAQSIEMKNISDIAKTAGVAALSFGAGVMLCLILPCGALVCIESALILGAGAVLFIK